MFGWYLSPWSFQYVIGIVITLLITISIFIINSKSWAYRSFLCYGICMLFWCCMVFLHRNAPGIDLSALFFSLDLFFVSLSTAFLLLMVLFLWKEKVVFVLCLIPGLLIGLYIIIFTPFDIVSANPGWTYVFKPYFFLFHVSTFGYILLCLILLIYLMNIVTFKMLKKKFRIIITGIGFCYSAAIITNKIVEFNPKFPPFGGIWLILLFIFIAIAFCNL